MSQVPAPSSRYTFGTSLLAPVFAPPPPTLKGNGKSWVVTLTGTAGDDVFDPGTGIGGSTLIGNGGDDVFYVHSGADKVVVPVGGAGRATIIVDTFANYTLPANVANLVGAAKIKMNLVGNGLDNIIRANDLGDTLDGGAGADALVGGAGRDTFIVSKGNGSDTLYGFQAGATADAVSLRGYTGLGSFTAVQAGLSQVGADTVLTLGGGETLTFANHLKGDFVAANFGLPNPVVPASPPPTGAAPTVGGGGAPPPNPAPPPATTTYAAAVPKPSGGSDIVGLNLQNPTGGSLSGRFVTFGQEFAPGQVPAGRVLRATINGVVQTVQMDVKATNPDGSVRMAVITLAQPTLAANTSAGVMLSLAPAGTPRGTPVDVAALTRGGYPVAVDLTLHNANGSDTAYHIDAAQALSQALAAGKASTWLSGPDATQVRIDVPVAGSLHLTFDITAYADGTNATDVQFNNDIAMSASGGTVRYDATIRQNGAVQFSQSNIQQFQYQTWHKAIASNGVAGVNVQHDVAALEAAGFVQNYDLSNGVATSLITANANQMAGSATTVLGTPSFGVLGNAGIVQYMPQTGGRADIGPTTLGNTLWLMTQNAQAQAYALAQADAAGSVPWHLYSASTGTYLTTTQYPNLWADARGGTSGTTGLTQPIPQYATTASPQSGWAIDPAHQPDLSYDAYLLTGNRYYLDQLNAQATYSVLALAPTYRQNGQDIVAGNQSQIRAQAWDLRQIQEAALINPDNAPLKAYFTQAVNNTFTYLLNTVIPDANKFQGEVYGWLPGNNGTGDLSPWQQDYFGQVVVMAAEQGNVQAKQVLHWESNFLVGRFLQSQNGFDPHDGAAYDLKIGPTGNFYDTWAEIEQATAQAGFAGNFSGQWDDLAYPGYRAWALATVAGDYTVEQSPQAIQAYGWLQANAGVNGVWQANSPQYNIVPRLTDGTLLTAANLHNLTGTANSAVSFGNANALVYDNAAAGDTTITGGSGIDILFAGGGRDLLLGGAGNDYLFGGIGVSGADTLAGGSGSNWLQAGTAGTQFNFAAADLAQDIVSGFLAGRDTLHVTGANGATLTTSQLQAILNAKSVSAGGITLTLAPGHLVTINNIAPAQLTTASFV